MAEEVWRSRGGVALERLKCGGGVEVRCGGGVEVRCGGGVEVRT